MDRKNYYEIFIEFKNKENENLFKGDIEYQGSKSYRDEVIITKNSIRISASRSSKINIPSIFYNHNSSLYNQIIKCISYYYTIMGKPHSIFKINILRKSSSKTLDQKEYDESQINQVVTDNFKFDWKFDKTKLQEIFSESDKGKTLLNSLSHFLSAQNSRDSYAKFERLWKSFNPLYRLIGKDRNEFENLKKTRLFILNNPECLKNSLKTVSKISKKEFRERLRWRQFIINNYPAQKDTRNYKNSILRCSDHRVMNVYLETINNRKKFLIEKGWFQEVENHLKTNINQKTKKDNDLLSVLVVRYMYFVRNKSFHGEKIDSTFRLTVNKELNEFSWLNERLEPLIIDLFNSHHKF